MTVPAAKVKALCTSAEASLVRASRKADLTRLDRAEVKKLADRARALRDKWRDLNRSQSRGKGATHDAAAVSNSKLKEEIFREAQESFDAHLAKLDKDGAAAAQKPRAKVTKERRAAEHRATRAAVRKGMSAAEDLLNVEKRSKAPRHAAPPKPAAAPPKVAAPAAAASQPATAAKAPAKKGASRLTPPPAKPAKSQPLVSAVLSKGKQRQAVAAAKQTRIAKSGKTTRLRAHVKSQGKRTQARRDAK